MKTKAEEIGLNVQPDTYSKKTATLSGNFRSSIMTKWKVLSTTTSDVVNLSWPKTVLE